MGLSDVERLVLEQVETTMTVEDPAFVARLRNRPRRRDVLRHMTLRESKVLAVVLGIFVAPPVMLVIGVSLGIAVLAGFGFGAFAAAPLAAFAMHYRPNTAPGFA